MMTTEVMMGNDHLDAKIEQRVISTESGQKQDPTLLEIITLLHNAETQVHYLKQRVLELEQLLQSK
jgi:hypothetical protein